MPRAFEFVKAFGHVTESAIRLSGILDLLFRLRMPLERRGLQTDVLPARCR